jgi:hypothetical protein
VLDLVVVAAELHRRRWHRSAVGAEDGDHEPRRPRALQRDLEVVPIGGDVLEHQRLPAAISPADTQLDLRGLDALEDELARRAGVARAGRVLVLHEDDGDPHRRGAVAPADDPGDASPPRHRQGQADGVDGVRGAADGRLGPREHVGPRGDLHLAGRERAEACHAVRARVASTSQVQPSGPSGW